MDDDLRSVVMTWMMTKDRIGSLTRGLCFLGTLRFSDNGYVVKELTTETEASV